MIKPGSIRPDDSVFRVFVYASFIPLHGLEHVVRAAHLLEQHDDGIRIEIVGGGDTEARIRRLASELDVRSVQFLGRRPYEELPDLDGGEPCVPRDLRHVRQGAARHPEQGVRRAARAARAVITGDTPAAREVLTHADTAWLCPPGDPRALADSILALRAAPDARARIARRGHELFQQKFCIDAIAADLAPIVLEVL